jgi:hypothetical protein
MATLLPDGHFHRDRFEQEDEEGLHQVVQAHLQRQGLGKEGGTKLGHDFLKVRPDWTKIHLLGKITPN